jgi:hypothetical protein
METHSAIKPMLWRTWIVLVVGPLIGFLGVPAGAELGERASIVRDGRRERPTLRISCRASRQSHYAKFASTAAIHARPGVIRAAPRFRYGGCRSR